MSQRNIYQRINAVMKVVEYVQKDATVSTGGGSYRAVSHDVVVAMLRPAMVKEGIVVRLEQTSSNMLQLRGPDNKQHLYSGSYVVDFVNMDNPADYARVTITAHANDGGDKAPGKAASYAVKSAMLKLFSLETGESDEARFPESYTAEQAELYHELLDAEKAYEFYLFTAGLPPETQTGLYNSFPDGKKSQGKKRDNELKAKGQAIFNDVVTDVKSRLDQHDISVIEVTDEMSPLEKKLLASRLSAHEVSQLSKIKAASI
jgi:hypothetical protein